MTETIADYEPPELGDRWDVDADHAFVGMDVHVGDRSGTLAALWLLDGEPSRVDVLTDDGILNTARERLEVGR